MLLETRAVFIDLGWTEGAAAECERALVLVGEVIDLGGGEATLACRVRGCEGLEGCASSSSSTIDATLGAEGRLEVRGGTEEVEESELPVRREGGLGRLPR